MPTTRMPGPRHGSPLTLSPPPAGPDGISEWLQHQLAPFVPYDGGCVGGVDPWALVGTSTESVHVFDQPEEHIEAEYRVPDVNKFEWLTTQASPVGVLSTATDGDTTSSYRYRHLIRPYGFAHELRAALVAGGRCWGYLFLLRTPDAPDFSSREAAVVGSMAPRLGAAMRAHLLDVGMRSHSLQPGTEPGIAVLNAGGKLESTNPVADELLAQLCPSRRPTHTRPPIPVSMLNAALTRSQRTTWQTLVPTASAGWLALRASRVNGTVEQRVVVSIEPAKPLAVAPLLLHARGLTERETAVALGVLRGMTTTEIAQHLLISHYTVQDHLKATFAKFVINRRRDLIEALFPGVSPGDLF